MTEREEFEASGITTRLSRCTEPGYESEYSDPHTQFAWRGWQAARHIVCPHCNGTDVELQRLCHNSSCSAYAREESIYRGWEK
jgi:hypothetical protein